MKVFLSLALVMLAVNVCYGSTEMNMVAGESKTINVENVRRVAVGNPKIADFSIISANEIRVVAISGGSTTLEIWTREEKPVEYLLRVSDIDVQALIEKLKIMFGTDIIRIVTMRPVEGGKIVLEGEYDTQDDIKRIEIAIAPYGDRVVSFLKPSKILEESDAFQIQKMIGIDTVKVNIIKNKLILDGTVPAQEDSERAEKIARVYHPNIVNTLKIGSNRMIQVDARIYEVDAEFTSNLNLNLIGSGSMNTSTEFTYTLLSKPVGGTFTSVLKLQTALQAAIAEGRARLLARPKLVTVNGGKATFNSGGEKGYQMFSSQGVPSVEWKKYGITLEVEPLIVHENNSENLSMHVIAEASELEQMQTNSSVPAILKSNADARIYMKPEETLLIAGLVKNKKTRVVSRFPILGYIPIIDMLFKSSREEIAEKEMLMFITPAIVSSRSMLSEYHEIKSRQDEDYKKMKYGQEEVEK